MVIRCLSGGACQVVCVRKCLEGGLSGGAVMLCLSGGACEVVFVRRCLLGNVCQVVSVRWCLSGGACRVVLAKWCLSGGVFQVVFFRRSALCCGVVKFPILSQGHRYTHLAVVHTRKASLCATARSVTSKS